MKRILAMLLSVICVLSFTCVSTYADEKSEDEEKAASIAESYLSAAAKNMWLYESNNLAEHTIQELVDPSGNSLLSDMSADVNTQKILSSMDNITFVQEKSKYFREMRQRQDIQRNDFALEYTVTSASIEDTDIAHNFEMQGETIENLISPRTKAIMINTPNNPTGCVMSEDSLYRIAEIAVKHDLLVISDDVYNTLIYDGAAAPLIAAFPHMRERTVIVNSFSKSFAMTGWRIGFVAGPAEIVDRMTKCQENFNACANSVGQYACAVALDHPELSDMICKTFADRRSVLLKGLKHIEGIKCNCPRGAFYVFADISSFGLTSAEFCNRLLDEEKVVCIPGSAFGTCGEGFIRIAYTCAEEDLNKAILRIQRFCKKLSEKKG